jgi:hypothetical protein
MAELRHQLTYKTTWYGGVDIDRDLNAARNLAKLAHVAQSGWETQKARRADRETRLAEQVAVKREAGSVSA